MTASLFLFTAWRVGARLGRGQLDRAEQTLLGVLCLAAWNGLMGLTDNLSLAALAAPALILAVDLAAFIRNGWRTFP